jgi:hypothetical protein
MPPPFGKHKDVEGLTSEQREEAGNAASDIAIKAREAEMSIPDAERTKIDLEELAILLAKAIRDANKDPIKEAQAKRAKARGQAEADLRTKNMADRESKCSHMFPFPYANITRVAWAQQSDGVWRGYCPTCGGLFAPGHPRYNELVKLPRHPLEAQPVSVGMTY